MVNPRRSWYNNITSSNDSQGSDNPFQSQSQSHSQSQSLSFTFSISSLCSLLKRPLAFPFLLSFFIFLTWVSLRFQNSSKYHPIHHKPQRFSKQDDLKANLVRFSPSKLAKDKRGWLLNPVAAALNAGVSGGAMTCVQVHVGEIRPGGLRGNHRHYTCNETFIIWGARVKFRLENIQVDKGYAEVVIGADDVAVAASPCGTGHALVNIDPIRTAFLLGCQDGMANYNSSSTSYNIWNDL